MWKNVNICYLFIKITNESWWSVIYLPSVGKYGSTGPSSRQQQLYIMKSKELILFFFCFLLIFLITSFVIVLTFFFYNTAIKRVSISFSNFSPLFFKRKKKKKKGFRLIPQDKNNCRERHLFLRVKVVCVWQNISLLKKAFSTYYIQTTRNCRYKRERERKREGS